jgi:hypothetical protein
MSSIKRFLFHAFSLFMLAFTGVSAWSSPFSRIPAPLAFFREHEQDQPKQEKAQSRTFTGTVVRDGEQYTLHESSGIVYLLDDSKRSEPFDGKSVKVTGCLGDEARIIHVESIEIIPA